MEAASTTLLTAHEGNTAKTKGQSMRSKIFIQEREKKRAAAAAARESAARVHEAAREAGEKAMTETAIHMEHVRALEGQLEQERMERQLAQRQSWF